MLEAARARADSILVGYSGGKDSRVVLDLCLRTFKRVEAFHMYLVPGLDCIELELDEARRRWGVQIRTYPHWVTQKLIAGSVYTPAWFTYDDLPEWKLQDVWALAMRDANIGTIAWGSKRADSSWRRRFMATFKPEDVIQPIAGWHKYDVLAYLRAHAIPEPPNSGHTATGIDLSVPSLLWLEKAYPRDFEKLCRFFPFAEAVIWREKFYGSTKH